MGLSLFGYIDYYWEISFSLLGFSFVCFSNFLNSENSKNVYSLLFDLFDFFEL